jgi:hypothetical protein
MKVSEIIKNSTEAIFSHYRQGYLYYRITVKEGQSENRYVFPVEIADLGTATVSETEKPITMMRYIRKAIDDGSFVRVNMSNVPPDLQKRFDRIKSRIFFEWNGSRYSISNQARTDGKYVKLPDGTLLKPFNWADVNPTFRKVVTVVESVDGLYEAEIDYTDCLG